MSVEKQAYREKRITDLRPIPRVIRPQAPNTPTQLIAYWPKANAYAVLSDKPACCRKYVEKLENELPLRFWIAQHMQTICSILESQFLKLRYISIIRLTSVRRRSTPLKQSR